jgi:hypothetical protein
MHYQCTMLNELVYLERTWGPCHRLPAECVCVIWATHKHSVSAVAMGVVSLSLESRVILDDRGSAEHQHYSTGRAMR